MTSKFLLHPAGRGMARFTLLTAIAIVTLATGAFADPSQFGELLVAKGVTVNGTPATGGLTVVSGSAIATKSDGRAIVNLGKVGRVTLGSETQLILNFSEGKLSGDLVSGWAVVSAPRGVAISIKTSDGIATADGDNASNLRIDLTGGTTRVEADKATLTNGDKKEFVAAGEEIEFKLEDAGFVSVARRSLEAPAAVPEVGSIGDVIAASVRGAVESVILDRTLATAGSSTAASDVTRTAYVNDTKSTQLVEQVVTCGDFNELCGGLEIGCQILPFIIKAKAGCTLGFILSTSNVQIPTNVTIRPYMGSACFFLSPSYPQVVTIPPGGAYAGQINARNCPRNAYQFAQNKIIVAESDNCGTQYIQVEWATPCI